jgi:carboxylate-amine ligase
VQVEPEPFAIFDDPRGVDFTIGVEEEFFVVDRDSRALRTDVDVVLDRSDAPEGHVIDHELKRSQAETGTAVCEELTEVRASVTELRRRLATAAESIGGRLLASGTHPFAHWSEDGGVTPEAAYVRLEEKYGQLTVEQAVCGCHVHVGVRDPDLVVQVMNRARLWVPLLVALSANSPYWMGEDSRYASYRTEVFHRWPTAGIPEHFEDRAAYDRVVADLQATGVIDGPARVYWDVRPSARYPTLEFRASDVMMTVDEAVALAGVIRAVVETCHADAVAETPYVVPRPELLRAALWRAARFGLSDRLIDLDAMRAVPAADYVTGALERLRPVLERRGEWTEVRTTVGQIARFGTGADRQRTARMQTGDLERVVDAIADATTAGTGLR